MTTGVAPVAMPTAVAPRVRVGTRDLAWVLCRRHRAALWACGLVTAVLVVGLLVEHARLAPLRACIPAVSPDGSQPPCVGLLGGRAFSALLWLKAATVAPVLFGVLVAAPLLPREYEQQTYPLTAVSSVSRARWLRAQILATVLAATGFGTVLALAAIPVRSALVPLPPGLAVVQSGWDWQIWGSGWLIVPYAVFACAAGLLAGSLLRRTLPALILTAVVVSVLRVGAVTMVQPHWWTPERATTRDLDVQARAPATALVLDWHALADARGRLHSFPTACTPGSPSLPTEALFLNCLTSRGLVARVATYQPTSRITAFELAEAGAFLLLSIGAIGAVTRLERRDPPA